MGRKPDNTFKNIRVRVWFFNLLRVAGVERDAELTMRLGLEGDAVWGRYRNEGREPQRYLLKQVEQVFPGTSSFLSIGPCGIFEVMQANRVQEAVKTMHLVIEAFFKKQESEMTQTPFPKEGTNPAPWLEQIGGILINQGPEHGMEPDLIYPLALAAGHSASRFIGNPLPLAKYVFECLEHFRSRYHVDLDLWAFDEDIREAAKLAGPHRRLRALERKITLPIIEPRFQSENASIQDMYDFWIQDKQAGLDYWDKTGTT